MDLEDKTLITRREALKRMGAFVAGVAMSTLPLPAMATIKGNERKRIVFYFTGTGNCLYISQQLGSDLRSIPQVMKGNERSFEADEIGLVYPVYYFSMPRNVERFLHEVKLKADYLFCIQTYSTTPGDATDYLRYHAAQNGLHFDYVRSIQMPSNYLPFFDVESDENMARGKDIPAAVAATVADLAAQKRWIEPTPELRDEWKRTSYTSPKVLDKRSETLFSIDPQKCIHCGVCTRVCPSGNYKLQGAVVTSGDCLYCLACANACPQMAITVLPKDVNPEHRYTNPNISVNQIIEANEQ